MSYEEVKYSDGSFKREWKNAHGLFYREDGPAIISYRSDGSIEWEHFYLNGVEHREVGPAEILYYPNGSIKIERFYLNGEYLGTNNIGFWAFWDRLTDDKRNNPELLKYLVRFS
jgi:antitoxin component YwqK of YwqJK toxin-antitoxin module